MGMISSGRTTGGTGRLFRWRTWDADWDRGCGLNGTFTCAQPDCDSSETASHNPPPNRKMSRVRLARSHPQPSPARPITAITVQSAEPATAPRKRPSRTMCHETGRTVTRARGPISEAIIATDRSTAERRRENQQAITTSTMKKTRPVVCDSTS